MLLDHYEIPLPGTLKRKISWALSYKILPPEITKTWEITILGGTLGAWEPMWNSMAYDFLDFWKFQPLSFLVKNRFNFKLGFFTYLEYISGGIIKKTFYIQITIAPGNIDAKKTRKTLHKLHINVFLNVSLWTLKLL